MRLLMHLSFQGQCEAAFRCYEACLGGQIAMMLTYSRSPAVPPAPDFGDKICHATLNLGEQTLTGADLPADRYEKPRGFAVQLNLDDAGEAERIFNTLAESGAVHLPLQPTFWAARYGMITDRFGIPWEINCGTKRIENS